MSYQRAFPVFSIFFALAYALCFYLGDRGLLNRGAIFAYYPALGEFHWSPLAGNVRQTGPVMLWYGWTVASALTGLIAAGISLAVPPGTLARHWPRLVIAAPIISFAALCWMERDWFLR